jgi:hypothetical protein
MILKAIQIRLLAIKWWSIGELHLDLLAQKKITRIFRFEFVLWTAETELYTLDERHEKR